MKDVTDITMVLDRSGSMGPVQLQTIESFNKFLRDQQALPGEASLSLIQFDDLYEPNYVAAPLKSAAFLTTQTYQPRGLTALLDALGKTLTDTGNRLAALQEHARPQRVLFVIYTDGLENASVEYTREKVFQMIKHQREVYKWEFLYLGANQDAIATAAGMGIARTSAATVCGQTVNSTYAAVSRKVAAYRVTGVAEAFTDEERVNLIKGEESDLGHT